MKEKSPIDIWDDDKEEIRQRAIDLLRASDYFAIKREMIDLLGRWNLHFVFAYALFDNAKHHQAEKIYQIFNDVRPECSWVFLKWLLQFEREMLEKFGMFIEMNEIDKELEFIDSQQFIDSQPRSSSSQLEIL